MDTFGINWQYLLLQCISFILFALFVSSIVFIGLSIVRSHRPAMLSKHMMNLKPTSEGLVIPSEVLEGSEGYELRRFGKSLIVIPKNK